MSTDPSARLIYGVVLGRRYEWKVQEAPLNEWNERGPLHLGWYDDNDEAERFDELAWERLYEAIPGANPDVDSWRMEGMAAEYYGVDFFLHGAGEGISLILGVRELHFEVEYAKTQLIDPAELAQRAADGEYDQKIERALTILGLTAVQKRPGWLLASLYF